MTKIDAIKEYKEYQAKGLHIDMARGRPCKEQLDLSLGMMDQLNSHSNFIVEGGFDVRNYGKRDGIEECKALMAPMLGVPKENVIISGNSSLNSMYDQVARSFCFGVAGNAPFCRQEKIKWLCPVPGYDRHFAMTEAFGFEMIPISMDGEGPDMDEIERLIQDETVKGVWCVPKYSNPSGITYSDRVVRRFSRLKPAAKDFRVYWDNAYAVHDLYDEGDTLLNVYEEARKVGNEDLFYIFTSTSKITFSGSGIAAIGASENNLRDIMKYMQYQTFGHDKISSLYHTLFLKDINGIRTLMRNHAKILRPKFEIVDKALDEVSDIATHSKPRGGYFVLVKVPGKAKEVVERCKECGIIFTGAGATHPYHNDPENAYIRIAPSAVSEDNLRLAMRVLCLSVAIEAGS